MSDRELVLDLLRELPEDVSMEEIVRQLAFLQGIQKAIEESDQGLGIPIEEVRERMKKWPSKSS
jgi:hypothetical protein